MPEQMSVKNMKMSGLKSALAWKNKGEMDRYACSEILDGGYYKALTLRMLNGVIP